MVLVLLRLRLLLSADLPRAEVAEVAEEDVVGLVAGAVAANSHSLEGRLLLLLLLLLLRMI